jgi:hypothetical protein
MQMSESVALLRALRTISKSLGRAERIVGEMLSKDGKRGDSRPSRRPNFLIVLKKDTARGTHN